MSGHRKWQEIRKTGGPESEARVAALRDEMDRLMSLAELRKARELTQTQLAEALETTQPGVSAIENRTDLYVSTLRSYVEALGGRLEIKAVFPTETVEISSFAELGDRTIEYGVRSYDIDNGIVRVIWRNLRDRHDSGDEEAGQLADVFEPLVTGRIPALQVEPGSQSARILLEIVSQMAPPSGRLNPPFARLRDALEHDSAAAV